MTGASTTASSFIADELFFFFFFFFRFEPGSMMGSAAGALLPGSTIFFESTGLSAFWRMEIASAVAILSASCLRLFFLLLFFGVRRFLGSWTALAACAIWALTPLHLVFAHMVNHEQGSIFWLLAFVFSYVRWCQTRRRRHVLWGMVALSMAAQFDWPAYYIAFFVFSHAIVTALRTLT